MWIVTKDQLKDKIVQITSRDFKWDAWETAEKTKFRLLDDDHNVYFYGEYDGVNGDEDEAFAPLDRFGEAYGCTYLQYKEDGVWKTL